ncbi:MAG: hypothetical protein IJJ22_03280 [Oscillospiraceae bacterium]|nr:hypothetical protein [Oscillospiraceae bacterium]
MYGISSCGSEENGEGAESMLYVLAVLHNRTCAESTSCQSLMAQTDRDFRVMIYDNSDPDLGIEAECAASGWTYLGGCGNRGLSPAYNCALDRLMDENAEGHICLLDDDTRLGQSFISEVKASIKNNSADILLPVLSQNGKIISPWREKGRRYFASYEECLAEPAENLLAFNSGMIIPLDYFRDYRYDERLFLDCVDISFLTEMKKRGRSVTVIPVFGEQSFSGAEKPPRSEAMNRFMIYTKDMLTWYGKRNAQGKLKLFKRALHLALIYRTLKPFITVQREMEKRT